LTAAVYIDNDYQLRLKEMIVVRMALLCGCILGLASIAARADDAVFEIKLAQGCFVPPELVVPAETAFRVQADLAAIEFESFELHRERVVRPGETITVYVPALPAGSYPFFDDFHSDTPHGAIVAK
jgi:Cupredoxin-like domain